MKKGPGASGLDEKYWLENYSEKETMDGYGNAHLHAAYLKAQFELEQIDISSVIDFGSGFGELFKAVLAQFIPYRAMAIEPSPYVFAQLSAKKLRPVESTRLRLQCVDLVTWAEKILQQKKPKFFDLGLCTSVFQYLSEEEIDFCLPIMARQVKYLYFSVPTDRELVRQVDELEFHDRYAISRPQSFYLKKLAPHFTVVSCRLLESRVHFNGHNTFFTDLLFRF